MSRELLAEFQDRLDSFVFFHLGSDAEVAVQQLPSGLRVAIRHSRVHPFEFSLDSDQLEALTQDSDAFEEYMLSELTRHRRGGLTEE